MVLGHATFCIVVVFNNVVARLRRMGSTLEEASVDLGADVFTTFRAGHLPDTARALVAGALLAFALSFDEIVVTTFTAGAGVRRCRCGSSTTSSARRRRPSSTSSPRS